MAIERDDDAANGAAGDAALVARVRQGDRAAADELVARHVDAVYRVAFGVLGDRDRAADAAQDAFVRALEALDGFRGDASFKTWLLRITANTARSAGRRTTNRREVPLEPVRTSMSDGSDPAREVVVRTEAERARAALDTLPEKQRLAVQLRISQGLSHREIGEVIGSSEGSARVNYHLGIKRLREMLS